MPDVQSETQALIKAILHSDEYTAYQRLGNLMAQDDSVRSRVNQYRRETFDLYNRIDLENPGQALEHIRHQFADVLEKTDVRDYLAAEQALITLMKEVFESIGGAVDFNLDFLKE